MALISATAHLRMQPISHGMSYSTAMILSCIIIQKQKPLLICSSHHWVVKHLCIFHSCFRSDTFLVTEDTKVNKRPWLALRALRNATNLPAVMAARLGRKRKKTGGEERTHNPSPHLRLWEESRQQWNVRSPCSCCLASSVLFILPARSLAPTANGLYQHPHLHSDFQHQP